MEIIETGMELGWSEQEISARIQRKTGLTEDEAKLYIEKYSNQ